MVTGVEKCSKCGKSYQVSSVVLGFVCKACGGTGKTQLNR